jgi:hypothetical protein
MTQGPDPKAANELISIDGVLNAIIRNLEKAYVSPYGHFLFYDRFIVLVFQLNEFLKD